MKKAYLYIRSAKRKDPITHQGAIWTDWEVKEMIEGAQRDAYNEAWEHAIALRRRIGSPYNEHEGNAMLDFEIEARKLMK